jgi:membrane-associated phospholipid phosphatase
MSARLWWLVLAVFLGALISGVLLSRLYVGQHVPPVDAEQLVPRTP